MAQQQLNQLEGRVERPWFRAAVFLPVDPQVMPEDILPTILGPEEQLLYRRRFLSIRTYQRESLRGFASLYNFRLPDQDSLQQTRHHLDIIFQRQATAFRFNAALVQYLVTEQQDSYDIGTHLPTIFDYWTALIWWHVGRTFNRFLTWHWNMMSGLIMLGCSSPTQPGGWLWSPT